MEKNIQSTRRLLLAVCLLLSLSFFFPYWEARQCAKSCTTGPELFIYAGRACGQAGHFPSLPPELGRLKTSIATAAGLALALIALAAVRVENRWSMLLWLPAILLPGAVLADAAGIVAPAIFPVAAEAGGTLSSRPGAGGWLAFGGAVLLTYEAVQELRKMVADCPSPGG